MKQETRSHFYRSIIWLTLFINWTAAIQFLDVQPIGPADSAVGFALLNAAFHQLTGVHMKLYIITDWFSLIPIFIMMFFAVLGLIQWIKRRSFVKVDADILLLGALYLGVFISYILFEIFPVNYRPVLIDGFLESSYPSSTTLLVLTVMPAAIIQTYFRISSIAPRRIFIAIMTVFTGLMVLFRLISGVHWITDIIGGALLSAALVETYVFLLALLTKRPNTKN